MKRTAILTIILMSMMGGPAGATEFWAHFANHLAYNVSVHTGTIPSQNTSLRLSEEAIGRLSARAFTQALPVRFGQVARQYSLTAIPCAFTPEPQKCYLKIVLTHTFDEVGFVRAPGFSQKFIEKYATRFTRVRVDETTQEKKARAAFVPKRHAFNPQFGVDLEKTDIVFASPFYSYFGLYVEPKLSLRHHMSLSMLWRRYSLEFTKEGAALNVELPDKFFGRGEVTMTIRPEGEFYIENVVATW